MSRPPGIDKDLITVSEFFRLVEDGQKADLIDGVIYMASPDSRRANELTAWLNMLLLGYISARELGGKVFVNRFAFILNEIRAPEPDVAYVGADRLHLLAEGGMQGGPDIAVEIVSRESRGRDYGEKKKLYEDAGVAEYWIIDPLKDRAEFHVLHQGRYQAAAWEPDGVFRSTVIPGLWLEVKWLLADPAPNCYRCLGEVLATGGQD